MTASILLIEDDLNTALAVQPALAHEGFLVQHALPGRNALRQILIEEPTLVVLGINIRNGGWDFCQKLLTFLEPPLLLLLTGTDKLDRVRGLNMGADACMFKPVLVPDLVAQIRALLRQSVPNRERQARSFFVDGDLEVDLTRREVKLNDEPIDLSITEYRVLACLIQHRAEFLSRERLQSEVWGSGQDDRLGSVKQYIYFLRQKLEADPKHPQRIISRRGRGYKLRRLQENGQARH